MTNASVSITAETSLRRLLDEHRWLTLSNDGIVRCPFLVKGRLVDPPEISLDAITGAYAALDERRGSADSYASYVVVGGAQVLRHRQIDRETMRGTERWIYSVMPRIDGKELVETDIEAITNELYAISHDRMLEWLRLVSDALEREMEIVLQVRELDRAISEHPDAFGHAAFLAFPFLLSPDVATASVDAELSQQGIPGRRLLDEWVELPVTRVPGPVHFVGSDILSDGLTSELHSYKALVRAMPTRQLHITAGNSPLVPLISMLRAVWTKSPCALKLPSGAVFPGSLVALVAATAAPHHPITRHLSMVYWRGGDESVERMLFLPGAFDRIVVWGAPDSVASVRERARFTKIICFNPRYSVSFIGHEAFSQPGDLDEVAARAVCDSMVENQKACIASLVHYVEGSVEDAERYAAAVERSLARWDEQLPHPLLNHHRALLKRLERGALLDSSVHLREVNGTYCSGVVVAPHDFAIKDHPMCRLIVVRPVASLDECLRFLHAGVATVGIIPDDRRRALRDRVAAYGVSNIVPLGHAGATAIGSSHDGMLVLSELVDWKNG
jgi:acyl-CoA reductase LuxC